MKKGNFRRHDSSAFHTKQAPPSSAKLRLNTSIFARWHLASTPGTVHCLMNVPIHIKFFHRRSLMTTLHNGGRLLAHTSQTFRVVMQWTMVSHRNFAFSTNRVIRTDVLRIWPSILNSSAPNSKPQSKLSCIYERALKPQVGEPGLVPSHRRNCSGKGMCIKIFNQFLFVISFFSAYGPHTAKSRCFSARRTSARFDRLLYNLELIPAPVTLPNRFLPIMHIFIRFGGFVQAIVSAFLCASRFMPITHFNLANVPFLVYHIADRKIPRF